MRVRACVCARAVQGSEKDKLTLRWRRVRFICGRPVAVRIKPVYNVNMLAGAKNVRPRVRGANRRRPVHGVRQLQYLDLTSVRSLACANITPIGRTSVQFVSRSRAQRRRPIRDRITLTAQHSAPA